MSGVRTGLAAAAALVLCGMAGAAEAAHVTVTYTGVVANSQDLAGVFGAPGQSLDGATYVATYAYDTSIGATYDNGLGYRILYGGPYEYGFPGPGLEATLTINGHTITSESAYQSHRSIYDHVDFDDEASDLDWDLAAQSQIWTQIYNLYLTTDTPADFDSPYVSPGPSNDALGHGQFDFRQYKADTGVTTIYARGDLLARSVSIVTSVPEPQTWALLIAGFSVAGVALRRRRGSGADLRA